MPTPGQSSAIVSPKPESQSVPAAVANAPVSTATAAITALAVKPAVSVPKPGTAAKLKDDYNRILSKVQMAVKDGKKLEAQLLAEVREKVKAHAGDLEDLQRQKRAAHAAWEIARDRELMEADRAKLHAGTKK